jgi:hypothetical protein
LGFRASRARTARAEVVADASAPVYVDRIILGKAK